MPTLNPRVNVTLSPSLYALVGRLAALQEVSMSQVLRELLEAAEPALQRAATLMEAASRSRGEVLDGLARSLSKGQDLVEEQLSAHLANLDSVTGDLVSQAQAVRGRRPGSAAPAAARDAASSPKGGKRGAAAPKGGSTPVAVTRGSGSSRAARRGGDHGPV